MLLSYLLTILMLCGLAAADDFGWCVFGRQGPAVVVEGKVAEGESFERQIGPNLVFRLATEPGGWSVVVTELGKSDDYAGVVHLPLRFDYTLDLQAWHFVEGAQGPGRQRKTLSDRHGLHPSGVQRREG